MRATNGSCRKFDAFHNSYWLPIAAGIVGGLFATACHFIAKASNEATAQRFVQQGCSLTRVEAVSFGVGSWKRTWVCPGGVTFVM